jgi:hypothetical protein
MTSAPRRRRKLILLFNDQECSLPPLSPRDKNKVESHRKHNLLEMVELLARRALPYSEWDIHLFRSADDLRAAEWLDKTEVPTQPPDLVIADIWFQRDDAETRNILDADLARHVLAAIKSKYKDHQPHGVVCILIATLPEPATFDKVASTRGPTKHADAVVDHFVPLAHTNLNGWDELFNLIKTEESRLIFREKRRLTKTTKITKFLKDTQLGSPQKTIASSGDLVIEPTKAEHAHVLNISDHRFDGFVIFRNCHFQAFRLRNCEFRGPVLLENCTFDRTTVLAGCKFFAHLNIRSCQFKQDFYIERCNFAPTHLTNDEQSQELAERQAGSQIEAPIESGTQFEHRLPWFSRTQFEQRFVFRTNTGVPPAAMHIRALMFHRCEFEGQVDLALPDQPTKLVFYACAFRSGQYVEIRYPFEEDECRRRQNALPLVSADAAMHSRFRPFRGRDADFDQDRVELRLCYCDLAARIVVRENPWALDPSVVDELRRTGQRKSANDVLSSQDSQIEASDANKRPERESHSRAIKYDPDAGIGLNLCGSTLTGSLTLRWLRVRWINCERMVVLGGAIFMSHSALRLTRRGRKRYFTGFHVLPEMSHFVFDELVGHGDEQARFSTLIHHSKRLIEFANEPTARIEMLRRIVQQYDDLAKAFGNASNSQRNEDFCHYKTMMYRGKLERRLLWLPALLESMRPWWKFCIALFVMAICAVSVVAMCWSGSETRNSFGAYGGVLGLGVVLALSHRARRYARGAFDWAVFRHMFAYLVYPSRIVLTAGTTIFAFAVLYAVVDLSTSAKDARPLGAVVDNSAATGDGRSNNGKTAARSGVKSLVFEEACRAMHFSAVTFTTLGYGELVPAGPMRVVSNLEAFTGALYLSMITAAMARQVMRR